jgi:hypothetical protein
MEPDSRRAHARHGVRGSYQRDLGLGFIVRLRLGFIVRRSLVLRFRGKRSIVRLGLIVRWSDNGCGTADILRSAEYDRSAPSESRTTTCFGRNKPILD